MTLDCVYFGLLIEKNRNNESIIKELLNGELAEYFAYSSDLMSDYEIIYLKRLSDNNGHKVGVYSMTINSIERYMYTSEEFRLLNTIKDRLLCLIINIRIIVGYHVISYVDDLNAEDDYSPIR
jgi:hypothetical protein